MTTMEQAMTKAGIKKPATQPSDAGHRQSRWDCKAIQDVAQSKKDWAVTKEIAAKLGVKL